MAPSAKRSDTFASKSTFAAACAARSKPSTLMEITNVLIINYFLFNYRLPLRSVIMVHPPPPSTAGTKRFQPGESKYCHLACYNKPACGKLALYVTQCKRCGTDIAVNTPIDKAVEGWVHLNCAPAVVKPSAEELSNLARLAQLPDDLPSLPVDVTAPLSFQSVRWLFRRQYRSMN